MKAILIFMLSVMLFATGCVREDFCIRGEGQITEVSINLDDFNSINLRGSMDVVISYGDKQEVFAEGHRNIIDHLETSVHDGIWSIGLDQGCFLNFELTVYITLPDLEKVELNGSRDILINDFNNKGSLSIENNGSGKISLDAVRGSEAVDIRISGSGPVQCYEPLPDLKDLSVIISGSGSFKGFQARADNCSARISGSGSCEVYVADNLDVNISGSGNVYYKGRPEITTGGGGSGRLISRN